MVPSMPATKHAAKPAPHSAQNKQKRADCQALYEAGFTSVSGLAAAFCVQNSTVKKWIQQGQWVAGQPAENINTLLAYRAKCVIAHLLDLGKKRMLEAEELQTLKLSKQVLDSVAPDNGVKEALKAFFTALIDFYMQQGRADIAHEIQKNMIGSAGSVEFILKKVQL